MTEPRDRALAQQAHMNRVRAVQRRSAYERVINKIVAVQALAPLNDEEEDQLKYLLELRGVIRKELIENGQMES